MLRAHEQSGLLRKLNVDVAAVRLLEASGWTMPDPEVLPRAGEVRDSYLKPLAALFNGRVRYGARVEAISRLAFDKVKSSGRDEAPFVVRVQTASHIDEVLARAVIDATGTWAQPNPIGANGLPARGEQGCC
ncbi:MAG: flavoprotein [Myxococcaceae bacterium]|nr:flavoprotein [Myxococcaceae bacterium]